jgi:hypothetical protein
MINLQSPEATGSRRSQDPPGPARLLLQSLPVNAARQGGSPVRVSAPMQDNRPAVHQGSGRRSPSLGRWPSGFLLNSPCMLLGLGGIALRGLLSPRPLSSPVDAATWWMRAGLEYRLPRLLAAIKRAGNHQPFVSGGGFTPSSRLSRGHDQPRVLPRRRIHKPLLLLRLQGRLHLNNGLLGDHQLHASGVDVR